MSPTGEMAAVYDSARVAQLRAAADSVGAWFCGLVWLPDEREGMGDVPFRVWVVLSREPRGAAVERLWPVIEEEQRGPSPRSLRAGVWSQRRLSLR